MAAGAHNRTRSAGWRRTYTCSAAKHLGRDVEHLDAYMDDIVIGRLSRPDAAIVLGGPHGDQVAALHTRREGIRARLDELSSLFADGAIDGPQLKRGTAELRAQLDGIEAELASARSASAVANLVLAGDDLRAAWEASPPDVRGKVIDALMTVTILPAATHGRQRGGGYFNPEYIDIAWKSSSK
jgi:hypothetical protein